MPPAKRKTVGQKDIRSFLNKENAQPSSNSETNDKTSGPGDAAHSETVKGCQAHVKEDHDEPSVGGHLHSFIIKFSRNDPKEYTIDCDQPRTVLDVIKSSDIFRKITKKGLDEKIVIQMGKEDMASIIATHFPCSCIRENECLIISFKPEQVEEIKQQHFQPVHARDRYSFFYIDREGGVHTKSKELFRSSAVKQYKYLCVYGEKGTSVEDAVKGDGRFIDDLGYFTLSNNENPNVFTSCTQRVDKLDQKEFKICLPLNKREREEKDLRTSGATQESKNCCSTIAILDVAQQSGISVRDVVEKLADDNTEEIYEILRLQFSGLKQLMESRFTADSYQEVLKVRKENFGKIQQLFNEVHRVKKLLTLGRSVCKLRVQGVCDGTGFVLFDNFILTNAHLFKDCVEGEAVREGVNVFALFNYEEPEPHTNYFYFSCKKRFIAFHKELDYAILELNPNGWKPNIKTKSKKLTVPPGLLKKFGPVPQNGEACIIGHPKGGVKQIDPTCIIEKERREEAVYGPYKGTVFVIQAISQVIKDQGIDNIMMGGNTADDVVTYHTFMYHGSSGSPVFDVHGQVFGLHSSGFVYGFPSHTESVIECAHPLLTIFENIVSQLREMCNDQLLKRVKDEAKENSCLKKILNPEPDNDEPMDIDEEQLGI